jgi:signal transduction histidine kinase
VSNLLHAPTILFAAGFVGLVGSLLLARNSGYGPRATARVVPVVWVLAAFLQALACFGHALRGDLTPFVAFTAVNATQLLAISLLWLGARRMAGHAAPAQLALLPPALWLAACFVPGFLDSQAARLALYTPLAFGTVLWAAFEMWRVHRRLGLRAALDMAALVVLVVFGLLAVVAHAVLVPRFPDGPQALFFGIPALLTALYGTTLPFLILAVTRERDAREEGLRRADLLREGRAQVERLHAGLPALIFLSEVAPDATTRLLYRGGDLTAVTGWPAEELARRPDLAALAHPEDVTLHDAMPRLLAEGRAGYEWRLQQPDGGWRWLHSLVRVLERRPEGGAVIVGYTIDIQARHEAEARAMAAARLASLGEMAAGIAHELRQPLQVISLAAELGQYAVREHDLPGVEGRLDRIVEQTQRTSQLLERLRRFARGAEEEVPPQPVPLGEAVAGALELVRRPLLDQGVTVELALGEPLPVLRAQEILLDQVLSNLLRNACDALAAQPPGAPRRIRIAAERGPPGMVRLTIADTGGGIAPEVMARLFEPFVTTKGPDQGTGLGLSICHGLVTRMGGTIEACNVPGGTVFTLTLPAEPN